MKGWHVAPLTRWVLAHKRIVVVFWVLLTLIGMASAGSATKSLKQKFSVPGKEGWVTNQQIARDFHGTGGNGAPLLPVVTLPAGRSVSSPSVLGELRSVEARLLRALPGSRVASYASTHNPAFVSKDGQTTFMVAYPPPDRTQAFEDNPKAAEKATTALAGTTVAQASMRCPSRVVVATAPVCSWRRCWAVSAPCSCWRSCLPPSSRSFRS
jgi:RND superfamily putative drug exporter